MLIKHTDEFTASPWSVEFFALVSALNFYRLRREHATIVTTLIQRHYLEYVGSSELRWMGVHVCPRGSYIHSARLDSLQLYLRHADQHTMFTSLNARLTMEFLLHFNVDEKSAERLVPYLVALSARQADLWLDYVREQHIDLAALTGQEIEPQPITPAPRAWSSPLAQQLFANALIYSGQKNSNAALVQQGLELQQIKVSAK